MAERLSIKAYARHRKALGLPGGSPAAVRKARERGQIEVAADGTIDPEAADRMWPADPARLPQEDGEPHGGTGEDGDPEDVPGSRGGTSLADARRRKELALAERREIEVQQLRGELVSRRAVASAWFEIQRITRDRVLLTPDRLAEVLAAESDPDVVRVKLETELRSALEVAAFDIERLAGQTS